MKNFTSLLLIISFIGIAIFGFFLFDMGPSHSGICSASAVDGKTCPTNIADFATHHSSALLTLTRITVPRTFDWLSLILTILLVAISIFLFHKNQLLPKSEFILQRLRNNAINSLSSFQKIISWLSLFELSPTF